MKPFLKHVSKTIVNSSCYITPNIAWLWMGGAGWHVTNSRLSKISLLVWIRVLALLTHSEEIYWQVKSWHTEVSGDCITHWAVQDVLEIVTSPGLALCSAGLWCCCSAQLDLTACWIESKKPVHLWIKLHTHYGNIHKLEHCWMTLD